MNLTILTSFVTLMLAVSIAVERMVEILKGWFPNMWFFKPSADPKTESHRCAWIHVLSGVCGFGVAWVGHIDLFTSLKISGLWPQTSGLYWAASWSITGLLASGGSAFWNHALDLIKATKVQQEQKAIAQVASVSTAQKQIAAAVV